MLYELGTAHLSSEETNSTVFSFLTPYPGPNFFFFFIWQLNGASSSSAFCCLDRRCPPQNIKLPGKHIDLKHSLLYFTGSIWSHFYYYTKYKWEITEQSTPETTMMYEIMSKTLLDDFVASSGRPVSSVWWCGRGVKVPERPHRQLAELENQHRECI